VRGEYCDVLEACHLVKVAAGSVVRIAYTQFLFSRDSILHHALHLCHDSNSSDQGSDNYKNGYQAPNVPVYVAEKHNCKPVGRVVMDSHCGAVFDVLDFESNGLQPLCASACQTWNGVNGGCMTTWEEEKQARVVAEIALMSRCVEDATMTVQPVGGVYYCPSALRALMSDDLKRTGIHDITNEVKWNAFVEARAPLLHPKHDNMEDSPGDYSRMTERVQSEFRKAVCGLDLGDWKMSPECLALLCVLHHYHTSFPRNVIQLVMSYLNRHSRWEDYASKLQVCGVRASWQNIRSFKVTTRFFQNGCWLEFEYFCYSHKQLERNSLIEVRFCCGRDPIVSTRMIRFDDEDQSQVFVGQISEDVLTLVRKFVFGPNLNVSNLKMTEIVMILAGVDLNPDNCDGWIFTLAEQQWPYLLQREKIMRGVSSVF
jgi:hypothetical protein